MTGRGENISRIFGIQHSESIYQLYEKVRGVVESDEVYMNIQLQVNHILGDDFRFFNMRDYADKHRISTRACVKYGVYDNKTIAFNRNTPFIDLHSEFYNKECKDNVKQLTKLAQNHITPQIETPNVISNIKNKPKVLLSADRERYHEFWPTVSKLWHDIGFDPILACVDDSDPSTQYGQVIKVPRLTQYAQRPNFVSKMARWHLCEYFPHDICMISDMDLLPTYPPFFYALMAFANSNPNDIIGTRIVKQTKNAELHNIYSSNYICGIGINILRMIKLVNNKRFGRWVSDAVPKSSVDNANWLSDEVYFNRCIQHEDTIGNKHKLFSTDVYAGVNGIECRAFTSDKKRNSTKKLQNAPYIDIHASYYNEECEIILKTLLEKYE